ncbi:hypothetical protein B0T13DRAFT_508101 [Neurospora crassa]|nr:hypothetical protein B0T13DRAFT_508101 [Neurospora crassa]
MGLGLGLESYYTSTPTYHPSGAERVNKAGDIPTSNPYGFGSTTRTNSSNESGFGDNKMSAPISNTNTPAAPAAGTEHPQETVSAPIQTTTTTTVVTTTIEPAQAAAIAAEKKKEGKEAQEVKEVKDDSKDTTTKQ